MVDFISLYHWVLYIWFVHGLELVYKLRKHQYCCLSNHFYLYVFMFNLYWFSWNMNLEVYMVHWMTFVNCFGAIYTLIPCTVLLTHVHTLKIILLNWFYLLLLYLLFCWNWCFIEISFWYFVFLFLLVLPIIFVLWFFISLLRLEVYDNLRHWEENISNAIGIGC